MTPGTQTAVCDGGGNQATPQYTRAYQGANADGYDVEARQSTAVQPRLRTTSRLAGPVGGVSTIPLGDMAVNDLLQTKSRGHTYINAFTVTLTSFSCCPCARPSCSSCLLREYIGRVEFDRQEGRQKWSSEWDTFKRP